jgi:hypothetical protein
MTRQNKFFTANSRSHRKREFKLAEPGITGKKSGTSRKSRDCRMPKENRKQYIEKTQKMNPPTRRSYHLTWPFVRRPSLDEILSHPRRLVPMAELGLGLRREDKAGTAVNHPNAFRH